MRPRARRDLVDYLVFSLTSLSLSRLRLNSLRQSLQALVQLKFRASMMVIAYLAFLRVIRGQAFCSLVRSMKIVYKTIARRFAEAEPRCTELKALTASNRRVTVAQFSLWLDSDTFPDW
jgi:hypothetical protein